MAQVISTNISSLNAQRNLTSSQASLQTSLQRLSSGLRINSAKDDAAGLAISDRMTSQINGMNQAARNANDGISMTQTADGNLAQISANLQRMRDLSVQSANDTNTVADRASLQLEVTSLADEIDRISSSAQFNGKNLLDGTFDTATFQVGSNAGQTVSLTINGSSSGTLGLGTATATGAVTGTTAIDNGDGGSDPVIAGTMTINGTLIGPSLNDGVSTVPGGTDLAADGTDVPSSALSLANAINLLSDTTEVTATANTETTSDATDFSATISGLTINGQTIADADSLSALVANINLTTAESGVTAAIDADDATKYVLTAADGRNIDVYGDVDGSGFETASTHYGQVSLSSSASFTIANGAGGLVDDTYVGTGGPSISSQVLSGLAITAIDAAITTVNAQRANLGAMQTRFDSVIANLQSGAENLSAARSRIRDTDFAAETANLTRNQILQQAGTAMLAQANALPSNVLALLK